MSKISYIVLLAALLQYTHANTVCIGCTLVVALVSEALQSNGNATSLTQQDLAAACDSSTTAMTDDAANSIISLQMKSDCRSFVGVSGDSLLRGLNAGATPDEICKDVLLCDGQCKLFLQWPITPPPPPPAPTPPHFPNMSVPETFVEAIQPVAEFDAPMDTHLAIRSLVSSLSFMSSQHDFVQTLADKEQSKFFGAMKAVVHMLHFFNGAHSTSNPIAAIMKAMNSGGVDVPALNPCGWNLTCIYERVFDHHLPLVDRDGDDFASDENILADGLRGADWRGRDCNDESDIVYPGRSTPPAGNLGSDYNCNGIYGFDEATGESYESKFCKDTKQRGIAILGDSAAAHFHIPPAWVRARGWNLDNLLSAAVDELDWPQCSWTTAFQNPDKCPPSSMPMASMYQRMRARNLCMHRDFQNIGVNGARTSSMAPNNGSGVINGLHRDQNNDEPLLVIFALIGNDVCNGHPGTGHMTTPAEFYTHVTQSMQYLDTMLPAGSSVVFLGLVDGRVLWDTMHDRTHPIGVPYRDLYTFLSCNGANPCWGWLNANETWRNITTQRAEALNAVYPKVIANQKYKNFEMHFNNPDWRKFINAYVQAGGLAHELIEPVDGFHPSQSGHMLLAKNVWDVLEADYPDLLGPINPNNADIIKIFGDQGGYGEV